MFFLNYLLQPNTRLFFFFFFFVEFDKQVQESKGAAAEALLRTEEI